MEKWRVRQIKDQLIHVGWYFTPQWIKDRISQRRETKKAQRELEVFMQNKVSEAEARAALDKLDVQGDVMLHSSLVEIGNIQGRHKPFVSYLQEHVLDKGHTVLAVAIPVKGYTEDYLKSIDRFDKDAPIAMGVMATYYAKQEGAYRSLSPTHSVVAVGKDAEAYTAEHHMDTTPFALHSPFYKLMEKNGSLLLLGAGLKYMTIIHVVEDLMGDLYPKQSYEKKSHRVDIYKDGKCVYQGEYFAHSKWMSAWCADGHLVELVQQLPSTRLIKLGASEIGYVNARDVVLCGLGELRKGNSIYGYCRISDECRERIDYWINTIKNMPNE